MELGAASTHNRRDIFRWGSIKMSNQRNSLRNLWWGMLGNIITTFVAILIPRLFIVNYGSEVNGLLSSIRQIYVYLALLEAGVGDASVIALYGPIGRKDHQATNEILAATHYYYRKIGIIYAACVVALSFVYPLLLDTTIPYHVSCLVILLQGSGSVISYLFQGKYNMLLRVDNRNYVTTNLGTVTTVLTDVCRIVLLMMGKSIVAVQATYLVFNLIKMLCIAWYIKRNYPWIDLSVKPNFQAISQKSAVLVHQVSSLVFGHTDVLVLTFVCGLKTVSIYSMYATIYGMVSNLITITSNSVQSVLGQTFHNDRKKYIELQDTFETYYLALVFGLFSIASIFILPFMKLYTEGADINYIDWKLPVLFGAYQLISYGRASSNNIISFAGKYKETQWRAWLETGINLVVSFTCVFQFGIYGVLMGTIAALLYRANDIIIYANKIVLNRSPWPTYRRWLINLGLLLVMVFAFVHLPLRVDSYLWLLLNAMWVSIVVMIAFLGVNSIAEPKSRKVAHKYLMSMLGTMNKRRVRRESKDLE